MRSEAARTKMSATLKRIGHAPKVRGGNGHGPTVPQDTLARALGPAWEMEHVVKTKGAPAAMRYPPAYKIDIAYPGLKVAVEVDGNSHMLLTRQAQDAKKDTFLSGRGWTVLRFSNAAVMERLAECVATVESTTSRLLGRTPTSSTD